MNYSFTKDKIYKHCRYLNITVDFMNKALVVRNIMLLIIIILLIIIQSRDIKLLLSLLLLVLSISIQLYLYFKVDEKRNKIKSEYSMFLIIFSVLLESGYTVRQIFTEMPNVYYGELIKEIEILKIDYTLFLPFDISLRKMAKKIDYDEFYYFVELVLNAKQTGYTDIHNDIKDYASHIIDIEIEEKKKAINKVSMKLFLLMFVFVFPATLIIIIGPIILPMFEVM